LNGVIQFWDVSSGLESKPLLMEQGEIWSPAYTLLFNRSGDSIYINNYPRRATFWNIATGQKKWQTSSDYGAALTPDGKSILASRSGPNLAVLDVESGTEQKWFRFESDLSDRQGQVRPVAMAPDGKFATVVDLKGTIAFCESGGKEIRRFQIPDLPLGLEERITGKAFRELSVLTISPDGYWLAVGGYDSSIYIYEILTGQIAHRLNGHETKVACLSFSPDGHKLLSAANDGQVLLWSLRPKISVGSQLDSQWNDLASPDTPNAYRAIWVLSDSANGVELVKSRVQACPTVSLDKSSRLLADLKSDQFRLRESATRALSEMSLAAVPIIEEAMATESSADAKKRLANLLDDIKRGPSARELQQLRAVAVLELSATPAAREHLKTLASGAPGARLTEAAAAALKRLKN
jgi:WD40 repeat protein